MVFLLPGAEVGHHLVHAAGTQTAAEGEDHGAVARAQFGTDGFPVLRLGEHLRPDGIAHHDGLIRCAQLFHCSRHGGKHEIHIRCQQLVGHAGEGVLLMNGGVDAHFGGTAHHRAGHIAAAADHKIGFDLLHNGLCLGAREGQIPQRNDVALDVVQRQPALETGDLDMVEGIARLSYQTVLHALLAAGKVDLGRRVCLFDSTCNGKCRVDMAGSAAGSDQNSHDDSSSIISASGQAIGELPTGLRPQNSRYSSLRARRASSRLMVRSFSSASR